jgi:hypothetical protein
VRINPDVILDTSQVHDMRTVSYNSNPGMQLQLVADTGPSITVFLITFSLCVILAGLAVCMFAAAFRRRTV